MQQQLGLSVTLSVSVGLSIPRAVGDALAYGHADDHDVWVAVAALLHRWHTTVDSKHRAFLGARHEHTNDNDVEPAIGCSNVDAELEWDGLRVAMLHRKQCGQCNDIAQPVSECNSNEPFLAALLLDRCK